MHLDHERALRLFKNLNHALNINAAQMIHYLRAYSTVARDLPASALTELTNRYDNVLQSYIQFYNNNNYNATTTSAGKYTRIQQTSK